jgi:hypothetical protein
MTVFIVTSLILLFILNFVSGAIEVSYLDNSDSTCSGEFHTLGTKNCLHAHLRSLGKVVTDLLPNLETLDHNPDVRRIYMDVHTNVSESNEVAPLVDIQLDGFLTSRPWWIVIGESRTVHKDTNVHMVHTLMIRFSQLWEMNLRAMAAVQYPPPEQCGSFQLLLGKMGGSGNYCSANEYNFVFIVKKFRLGQSE